MSSNSLRQIVQQLRSAASGQPGAGLTDGELLTHFLSRRDDEAFAALVSRHAPMVWGVCCRLLRNPKDAEDAFQAAFLVLIQKAATIIPREMVANWLYGVAQKTAVRLRASSAKRGWREMQLNELPEPVVSEFHDNEMLSQLDEELTRLPERSRALIVLCDLEGHTRKEAAKQLGWPEGTVASGLVRARELLAKRLTQRGLTVSGAALAATLAQSPASADVPHSVVISTINVATLFAAGKATGVISGDVCTLTRGVLKTMFLKKILTTSMAVLALSVVAITGGSLAIGQGEPQQGAEKEAKPPVVGKSVEPKTKEPVPKSDAEKTDQERIEGLWQAEYLETQGVKDSNFDEAKYRLRIKGDKFTVVADGHTFAFELGTKVKPKTMNLIPEFGKALGKKLDCAIYELEGDMLKICMDNQGETGKRPKEFKTAPGDGFSLMVFKRVKEDRKEEQKNDTFIAWGKEIEGLQAGISIPNTDDIRIGGKFRTVVKLRNVSDKTIKVSAWPLWAGFYPKVVDARGNKVRTTTPPEVDFYLRPRPLTLKQGETVEAGQIDLLVATLEQQLKVPEGVVDMLTIHVAPGKFNFGCFGFLKEHPALSTGILEFEVKPAKVEKPKPGVNKPPHVVEKLDMKGRMESGLPFKVGAEPTEETIRIVTKMFISKMGTYPDYRFREFFDPRYLKTHGLTDKEIAFEVVGDYRGIYNYVVADDNRTILCTLLRTVDGKEVRELFIIRWVLHEGCLYVSPEKAPDPKTGVITPWILRTKP